MKKALSLLTMIILTLALGGCTGNSIGLPTRKSMQSIQPSTAQTLSPSPEATVGMPTPLASDSTAVTPTPSESMDPETADDWDDSEEDGDDGDTGMVDPNQTPKPIPDDLPAYIQAGLPKREKMDDVMESYYYYDFNDFYGGTFNGSYDIDKTDKVDLDGDGTKETVKVTFGEKALQENDEEGYGSVTIQVNQAELKLAPEMGYFTPEVCILDINEGDGKKEIAITNEYVEGTPSYIVLVYEGGTIQEILDGIFDTMGNGNILQLNYDAPDYYSLRHLRDDHKGFENVPGITCYYTDYLTYSFGGWDATPTQEDNMLAGKPGGAENIPIQKGTLIYFGLYDGGDWLQVLDAQGNMLGWLNIKKTDYGVYSNWAFETE